MRKIFSPKLICLAILMFSFVSLSARGEMGTERLQNHPGQFHPQYHPQGQYGQYHPGARGYERGVEAGAAGTAGYGGVVNPGYVVPYPTTTVVPVTPQAQPSGQ